MSAIVDTPEEAAALELAPLLVRRPLEAFLDGCGLGSGPVEAEPLGDGHSNITYLIKREGGEWVLRRPPRPPLPPSAHDVLREARLLSAVEDADVRTPPVLATCDDESVIGAPFYVMEKIEGDVVVTDIPPALDTPAERARMAEELIDALVEIHAVDWQASGLEGYGKPTRISGAPGPPVLRPVGAQQDPRGAGDRRGHGVARGQHARVRPGDDRPRRLPPGEHDDGPGHAGAVGGDLRLGAGDDRGSAGGRRLPDGDLRRARRATASTLMSRSAAVTTREGFPTRAELIARYEERSGRSMSAVNWYQTLAMWKSAVFLEGSYKRLLAGTTDDPFFKLLDEGVPEIARHALDDRAWRLTAASRAAACSSTSAGS